MKKSNNITFSSMSVTVPAGGTYRTTCPLARSIMFLSVKTNGYDTTVKCVLSRDDDTQNQFFDVFGGFTVNGCENTPELFDTITFSNSTAYNIEVVYYTSIANLYNSFNYNVKTPIVLHNQVFPPYQVDIITASNAGRVHWWSPGNNTSSSTTFQFASISPGLMIKRIRCVGSTAGRAFYLTDGGTMIQWFPCACSTGTSQNTGWVDLNYLVGANAISAYVGWGSGLENVCIEF